MALLYSHNSSFGFDIFSMSAIVGTDQYIDYFENPHGIVQGAIGSALAAGSVVGSLMAGPISDRWGFNLLCMLLVDCRHNYPSRM